jgi:hypothetical protein
VDVVWDCCSSLCDLGLTLLCEWLRSMDWPFLDSSCACVDLRLDSFREALMGSDGCWQFRECRAAGSGASMDSVSVLLGNFVCIWFVSFVAAGFPDCMEVSPESLDPNTASRPNATLLGGAWAPKLSQERSSCFGKVESSRRPSRWTQASLPHSASPQATPGLVRIKRSKTRIRCASTLMPQLTMRRTTMKMASMLARGRASLAGVLAGMLKRRTQR